MSKKKGTKKELSKDELARKQRERLVAALEREPKFRESMEELDADFRRKFGRDPLPSDPIFFDPTKDEPTPMSSDQGVAIGAELIGAMVKLGQFEFAYAYARSGYLVSEENYDLIPEEGLRAWNQAIREWQNMTPEEQATSIQGMVSGVRQ